MRALPIEVVVEHREETDSAGQPWQAYRACLAADGEHVALVPEIWIDLLPFLAARVLLERGFDVRRPLRVFLRGADFMLADTMLGCLCATPLVDFLHPVSEPTRMLYEAKHG